MQAIKAKNLGLTEFYIKNGAEVNGFFKNGSYQDDMTSPLIFAIASSTPEMVKLLLDNGADPNLQYKCEEKFVGTSQTYNYQSPTALHRACRVCDPSKVRLLLQAGANPNARDHYGKMPLHWACDEGSDNNFLANRCFNESTNYKNPFLKNCITIIGLLLKHGADKRDWKHFLDPTRNLNPEIAYAVDH
jgi:ankyrin repeat protein